MNTLDYSSFSATQKEIDRQQAEILLLNEQQAESEAPAGPEKPRPSLWRRLMQRLRR